MCLLEDTSIKRESINYLEIASSSTLYDFIVENTHVNDFESNSEFLHEGTLVEVDLSNTFL